MNPQVDQHNRHPNMRVRHSQTIQHNSYSPPFLLSNHLLPFLLLLLPLPRIIPISEEASDAQNNQECQRQSDLRKVKDIVETAEEEEEDVD